MKKIKTAKLQKKSSEIFENKNAWCDEMNRRARDVTRNVDKWKEMKNE